jgi:hypothetical protein
MLKFALAALLALVMVTQSSPSFACPAGYSPCGSSAQLCCPG